MAIDRREWLAGLGALGIGNLPFQRALLTAADAPTPSTGPKTINEEMIKNAEWIAGIELTDTERKRVAGYLAATLPNLKKARTVTLSNDTPLALVFQPDAVQVTQPSTRGKATFDLPEPKDPLKDDDLAFASIPTLAAMLRKKQISSRELTEFFLYRLKKFDPLLKCVVTLTEETALKQAKLADEELATGKPRSLLHGIPWGAKDLISYPGYPTTWGAEHFKDQKFPGKATVAERLDAAGAVLVAKLTLGALALGDVWFGGTTKNPWNPATGSSGSSAGSASAVAAGCVPFALGSETLGSIVSPSRQCGVTGLRPTFGRVPRTGCMTLCWTMDKIGPLARSAQDTAIVLDVIHGADGQDGTALTRPFDSPSAVPLKDLRVGYFADHQAASYQAVLEVVKKLGVKLVPFTLPNPEWLGALQLILDVESATAFDELTRNGIREGYGNFWPATFQRGQFVSAVEYLRANRLRSKLMQEMQAKMKEIDLYIGGFDLQITNLTGHPSICLPYGFVERRGKPQPLGLTLTGQLFGETKLLALAQAYQAATDFHTRRPPLQKYLDEIKR